jgi:hypothetical protein
VGFYAGWRGWSNGRSAELVRVAQRIVRCGECGGIGRGCLIFQRGVWALAVVVGDPFGELVACIVEAEEQRLVQELVAHPAVEALDEGVLDRLARRDEVPVDGVVLAPSQHGVAGELGAVVGDDRARPATSCDDRRQLPCHPSPRDGCVRDRCQTLLGDVIDDVEDAEASSIWFPSGGDRLVGLSRLRCNSPYGCP